MAVRLRPANLAACKSSSFQHQVGSDPTEPSTTAPSSGGSRLGSGGTRFKVCTRSPSSRGDASPSSTSQHVRKGWSWRSKSSSSVYSRTNTNTSLGSLTSLWSPRRPKSPSTGTFPSEGDSVPSQLYYLKDEGSKGSVVSKGSLFSLSRDSNQERVSRNGDEKYEASEGDDFGDVCEGLGGTRLALKVAVRTPRAASSASCPVDLALKPLLPPMARAKRYKRHASVPSLRLRGVCRYKPMNIEQRQRFNCDSPSSSTDDSADESNRDLREAKLNEAIERVIIWRQVYGKPWRKSDDLGELNQLATSMGIVLSGACLERPEAVAPVGHCCNGKLICRAD